MKNKFKTLAVVIIALASATITFGQDTESEATNEMKVFGLGLHVEQFKSQDLWSSSFVPVNKLIFTISPSNKWRLEPSIGYSKANDEYNSGNGYSSTNSIKGFFIGLGGFYMYQAGKTNIYFGLRIEQAKITDEYKYIDSNANSVDTSTSETKRFMFGPTIGAEYFLGKHFSFGGEFSLKKYNLNTTRTSSYDPTPVDSGGDSFSTETGLLLRFYF